MKFRRKRSQYHYRKRYLGLSVLEMREMNQNGRLGMLCILASLAHKERVPLLEILGLRSLYQWYCIAAEENNIEKPISYHMDRTINSFTQDECDRLFRFKKRDLPRLLHVLGMPALVKLDNRSVFTSEEVLLLCLCRMTTPGRMEDLARAYFGREYSQLARAFRWFLKFVRNTFWEKMTNNLRFWKTYFPACARAIRRKALDFGCDFNEAAFQIAGFIDDNCFSTCAPGGPKYSGRGSDRASLLLQRAFYNGWKAIHGLKWQTFDLPNGLTADMFGPRTVRANDLRVLRNSNLNNRMAELQEGNVMQYMIYGDGIFPVMSHIRSRHKNNLTARQLLENGTMAKLRISIEWHYGNLCTMFPMLDYKRNLKIRQQPLKSLYFTATFLRNCHVCIYGNNTSAYFDLPPPTLEDFVLG